MAILVAVGGAALGSAVGIGSSTGWMIGSIVGSLLFPSGEDTYSEGARLGDLSVSSSAYGAVRTIGFGTIRQSGNITWSSGIREQKNTRKVSGGKGGGSTATSVTYTYFASFAVAFGEGIAEDVLRMWADGNLIYDKTGTSTATRMSGLSFRFYPGDDDQLPDTLIQNDKGEENTPAFRGTCYVVYDDIPLARFGNRIPSITAEIAYSSTDTGANVKSVLYEGGVTSYALNNIAVDWDRQFAYVQSASANMLRRVNLATMQEDRQVSGEDAFDQTAGLVEFQGYTPYVMPDGGLVMAGDEEGGSNQEPIIRLDPSTLRETNRFGFGASLSGWPFTAPTTHFITAIDMYTPIGDLTWLFSASIFGTSFGLLEYPDFRYTWDSDNMGFDFVGRIRSVCKGKKGEAFGTCYFLNAASSYPDTLYIHKVTVEASATSDLIRRTSNGALVELVATLTAPELAPGETGFEEVDGLFYDQTDETLVFGFQRNSDNVWQYAKVDPEDGSVVWITDDLASGPNDGSMWGAGRMEDNTFGYLRGQNGVQIETQTGTILQNGTSPWDIEHGGYTGLYDSRTESFIDLVSSSENSLVGRWFFNRGAGEGETLASIVEGLCGRVNLESTDLDVTDLGAITVPGYAIGRQISSRAAIETLSKMYLFDGVESDFLLKFSLRGQDPVRTITQEEMAYTNEDGNDVLTETRAQEVELPEIFSITYMDKDNDYTQNSHSAKRIVLPEPSMYSSNSGNLSLALAISAETAKQQAEKILYSAWIERNNYDFRLDWGHLDLDPADVVNIGLTSGATFRTRIAEADVGVGFGIEASALSEEEAQYTSAVQAYAGEGVPEQTVRAESIVKTVLMDVPLLRDMDEPPSRAYNPLYSFMGGYSDNQFFGGVLYKSSDGIAYEPQGSGLSSMAWGATANPLGNPPFDNPFATDTENTITVFMQSGGVDLESVTALEMLNGANGAAIIKNNGEIEVIQFQNVTDNSDGSYTLDTLLRGRRGTDTMCYDHTNGELFVLLITADAEIQALTIAELNAVRYYRGVGEGQYIEEADCITLTSEHRALKPYAPVHVAAVANVADIDITWVRRTRVGGALVDGVGEVPLYEDTEAYEIDIYDGPCGTLLRTVTDIPTTGYTYLSADITTDFGTMPTQLTLKVYQISAQIGRGFTYEVTTDVG